MHYETQLRNFESVDFWIQNRRNIKLADCRTQDMLWHVVLDMVDQAETTKFSSKFHCRQLLVWRYAERSVLFLVQVDMSYYAPLAEWAAISGISGSIKKAWEMNKQHCGTSNLVYKSMYMNVYDIVKM